MMNILDIVKTNYKRFSFVEGNDYIASEYALITILRLIKTFELRSILEVGLGIGSISDTVLKYGKESNKKFIYTGTESNNFCLSALQENVESYKSVELYPNISSIKNDRKYDFIIVDGSDESLHDILKFCTTRTVIFVEGFRGSQVFLLKEVFPNFKHVEIISLYKNPKYGPFPPDRWAGGGQLIFVNPSFYQKIYWLYQKVNTFLKRRLRIFKK